MSQSAKFWDKISARYAKQPVADEAAYQKKLQTTREYLNPEMAVLEIGCGTGSTAILHAPYVKHIRAIDISAKMIEIAQNKLTAEKIDNITFEQSTIEDLKIEAQSIDAVMALSILHLVEDKDEVIAKVYDILKPGGVFVSSTICMGDSILKLIKLIAPLGMLLGFMPAVKVFTGQELEASIANAGFEIDQRWLQGGNKGLFIVAKKPAL